MMHQTISFNLDTTGQNPHGASVVLSAHTWSTHMSTCADGIREPPYGVCGTYYERTCSVRLERSQDAKIFPEKGDITKIFRKGIFPSESLLWGNTDEIFLSIGSLPTTDGTMHCTGKTLSGWQSSNSGWKLGWQLFKQQLQDRTCGLHRSKEDNRLHKLYTNKFMLTIRKFRI